MFFHMVAKAFALEYASHVRLWLLPSAAGTPEQAALVRSELLLTQRLKELSHELSDASLQQVTSMSESFRQF
jgi:hypothetical protein